MFFRGQVQICIQLLALRNIFIRRSTELSLRLSVTHEDPIFGIRNAKPQLVISNHTLPSKIDGPAYTSRPIRVFPSTTEIPVYQTILFRAEIDGFHKFPIFKVQCQLLINESGQGLLLSKNQLLITNMEPSHLPIYFDEFGFATSFEAEVYMTVSSFAFHNNQQIVRDLITKIDYSTKTEHIKKNALTVIPPVVKSFSQFIILMTNDNKDKVQQLYSQYIKYLNGFNRDLMNVVQNIESSNRTSVSPETTTPKQKRKIFDTLIKTSGPNSLPNGFTAMEIVSSQINSLWDCLVSLVSKPHPIYSSQLRKTYFGNLHTYQLSRVEGFSMHLKIVPIHQLQTNNYKVTIENQNWKPTEKQPNHIVVFVHGISAHSYDMESLANMIKFTNPHVQLCLSKVNQERTMDAIAQQGQRLALEIKNFIKSRGNNKVKISILGHSMGGLVARAALQYLEYYKDKLHALITICTPHLGQLLHQSTLIKTTMYLLNKFSPSQSMLQLNMQDGSGEESYIYKLSLAPGIGWFKNLILVNIKEDNIVPRCSARIESANEGLVNMPEYRIYHKMVYNMYKHLNENRVTKIEFSGSTSVDFDSFIGKSQHIQLIKDVEAIRLLIMILYNLF